MNGGQRREPGPIVLRPGGDPEHPTPVSAHPWALWQPVATGSAYTCTRCGQEGTGERYLELVGTEPQIFPVLPRNPAHLTTVTRRIGRQVLCPACRWPAPVDRTPVTRRKTTLD